ncbi:MAG: MauE/DoxX family redox-associated membrane protein [Phycisphaerales bacterium]
MLVGFVFLLAGAAKAWGIEAFVVAVTSLLSATLPTLLPAAVPLAIAVAAFEVLIGAGLVFGLAEKSFRLAALGLLFLFCSSLVYVWLTPAANNGCGCFGTLSTAGLASHPGFGIARNIVLI